MYAYINWGVYSLNEYFLFLHDLLIIDEPQIVLSFEYVSVCACVIYFFSLHISTILLSSL